MNEHFDFKKEWEKTKAQLLKFSKEAAVVAKKGEQELLAFSQKSKLQMDSTATHLKKEKLYYQIGKAYARQRDFRRPTKELQDLVAQLREVEREQRKINSQLKKSKSDPSAKATQKPKKKKATKKRKA